MENLVSSKGVCVCARAYVCLEDHEENYTCLENVGFSKNSA